MIQHALLVALSVAGFAGEPVVRISSIPPSGPYVTLGVASAHAAVPADGFWSRAEAFNEVLAGLEPSLASQARTKAADMVIITNISTHVGEDTVHVVVLGTLVRSAPALERHASLVVPARMEPEEPPAAEPAREAPASTPVPQAPAPAPQADLSGSWEGCLDEVGSKDKIRVFVNLERGERPGEYRGGLQVADYTCEFRLVHLGNDESRTAFGAEWAPGSAYGGVCEELMAHVAEVKDGVLQWNIYENASNPQWEKRRPIYRGGLRHP